MARDGNGSYSLPEAAFVYDTVIDETAVNSNFSDIASALTDSVAKDGQTVPTADLPMGTYRHTGVGNASARDQYAAMGQIQDGAGIWCGTAGGTADAITLAPSPAISAYAAGQRFEFKAGAASNTGAVTFAISGLSAIAGQVDGAACVGGEIEANKWYRATLSSASEAQVEKIVTLASGVTIKTINGTSLLGAGDITVITEKYNGLVNSLRIQSTTLPYALLYRGAADSYNGQTGIATNSGMAYDSTNLWFDATTDSNWANVTAILKMENNVTDSSSVGTTFTATDVTYSSSIHKIGSYSAYLNGTTAIITNGASQAAYQIGTGSVTLECWFYPTRRNGTNYEVFFGLGTPASGGAGAQRISVYSIPTSGYMVCDIGGGSSLSTTTAPTLNAWNHVALVRNGASAWTLYLNGASIGTATVATNFTDGYLTVGRDANTLAFNYAQAYIDAFRFTKAAVYTGSFTPRVIDFVTGTSQSLTSATFTALTAPTGVNILLLYQNTGTITLNTELVVMASRDGGTTWTTAVLEAGGAYDASTNMAVASVDVSAQPSGTSVKYKIETATTDTLYLSGSGIYWN